MCAVAPDAPVARFLADAVPHYIEFYERTRAYGGACMHDPLAVGAAIDPSMSRSTRPASRSRPTASGRAVRP